MKIWHSPCSNPGAVTGPLLKISDVNNIKSLTIPIYVLKTCIAVPVTYYIDTHTHTDLSLNNSITSCDDFWFGLGSEGSGK